MFGSLFRRHKRAMPLAAILALPPTDPAVLTLADRLEGSTAAVRGLRTILQASFTSPAVEGADDLLAGELVDARGFTPVDQHVADREAAIAELTGPELADALRHWSTYAPRLARPGTGGAAVLDLLRARVIWRALRLADARRAARTIEVAKGFFARRNVPCDEVDARLAAHVFVGGTIASAAAGAGVSTDEALRRLAALSAAATCHDRADGGRH